MGSVQSWLATSASLYGVCPPQDAIGFDGGAMERARANLLVACGVSTTLATSVGLFSGCPAPRGVGPAQADAPVAGSELGWPPGWTAAPGNQAQPGEAGYCIRHAGTGIEMVYVPGGTFMMGSPPDDPAHDPNWQWQVLHWGGSMHSASDEKPRHAHPVKAFWIGRTEVTVAQWRAAMGGAPPAPAGQRPGNDRDDHPVVWVSRDDTARFCSTLGLRLPTEAEWEYAAAGPESREFPWGAQWNTNWCCNRANRGPEGTTFAVGRIPQDVSWCGALDMAGNVEERCEDWYDENVYERYAKGDLAPPPKEQPPEWITESVPPRRSGLTMPGGKVVRGGSWWVRVPPSFRCAARSSDTPGHALWDDRLPLCAVC
ncbi:MAG: formylglycine-generating enzyme family protein [Armatimonadetes bacterium]|nr:formylglycine-generating enzyme family protein [Armatimonadota bacterium]